jgi:hypothetical protein
MTCTDREKQLPAYLEGELSPGKMKEYRIHLASCATCRKTLEDLKSTDRLVRGLAEVEPPPWLQQQIMTRVRQESIEGRGCLRKFFFPLYIKIPVQAFAVIVISVLAFYVYRQDAPQLRMKGLPLPPAPVFETRKDQAPPLSRLAPRKAPPPSESTGLSNEAMPAPEATPEERGDLTALPEPPDKEARYGSDKGVPENAVEMTPPVLSEKSPIQKSEGKGGFNPSLPEKTADLSPPETVAGEKKKVCERDMCLAEEKLGSSAGGLSASQNVVLKDARLPLELVLTVKDVGAAVLELDKYVGNTDARYTEISVREDKQVFTTELKTPFVGTLLEKLHTLGELGEYVRPEFGKDTQWVKIKIFIITSPHHKP